MALNQHALDGLPAEVLESVITQLPCQDSCSLRLVSRAIAANGHGAFQKHFATKTVKWTSTEQMQEFVYFTQANQAGCLLQHLTIVGVTPAGGVRTLDDTDDKLLTKALTNLRLNSTYGCLQSTVLLVQGQDDNGNVVPCQKMRDVKQVWTTAARTFEVTCRALAESALPIQKLDIFSNVSCCSLACDRIAPIIDTMDLSISLRKLNCLSLSLSLAVGDSNTEALGSIAIGRSHVESIVRLLELCPQLDNLKLHWYNIRSIYLYPLNAAQTEERRFFSYLVQSQNLSQLRICLLQGIYTNETTLLAFLEKTTKLSSLSMEEIYLDDGKFGPVFDYMTNHSRNLDHLYLDDLWENRLICFDGPGQPHFPSSEANGPNDITRTGVACQHAIKYRLSRGYTLGSAQSANWHRRKRLLYGPPRV